MKKDLEKTYPKKDFVKKLRRFAKALESNKPFSISVARNKLHIPKDSVVNIEYEKEKNKCELEFQIKWEDKK
ncbi:MAG TPA: amphi-Trp domain-containing protein [Candidatus Paceibacterota bacterium]|nr:amphi-Trp domain-containing protein [Candidatus Paceibacterota bacterium]